MGRLIKALHLPLLATFFLIAASLLVLVKSSFFSVEAQSVGGRIAFTSNRDGDFDIYVMNSNDLDDSDAINITNTLYYEAVIGWAADKIAFWSDKEGAMEMYVMDDNGGNIRKLQTPGGYVGYDTLSPDGTKISVTAGGVFNTYIVPTDGSPNYNLLPNRSCLNAEWSWDSQQLICMSSESSPDGIGLWLVNADGSNPRWTGLAARNAVWLPSSTRIIFHNDYDGLLSIADMEIPESTTPLIPNMNGMDPRITSNGNRVVFRLDGPGYQRIYTNTIDATDDSNLHLIAESPGYGTLGSAVWSPNNEDISYQTSKDGSWEIYIANSDGTSVRRITNNAAVDMGPKWEWRGVPQLSALSPAGVWVGLKNSDDIGIRFDLKAEVYKNVGELIASGILESVPGGSSGFNNAHLYNIPLSLSGLVDFPDGSELSLKVYVRNACSGSGKNSGGARLWFNDAQANSNFQATIDENLSTYYLLGQTAGTRTIQHWAPVNFGLAENSFGPGPKNAVDVASGAKCSPYKLWGTWSITP